VGGRDGGGGERGRVYLGGHKHVPALKIHSQCPLHVPVEVYLRKGKAVGRGGQY
jgi:hypothetical protein